MTSGLYHTPPGRSHQSGPLRLVHHTSASSVIRQALCGLLAAFALQAAPACEVSPANACPAQTGQGRRADALLERVRASLVQLDTGLGRIQGAVGSGSGFLAVRPDWVVTNLHVIDRSLVEPDDYDLLVLGSHGQRLSTRILAIDVANDLAVVQTALPIRGVPLELAPALPRQGQEAFALGSPRGPEFIAIAGYLHGSVGGDSLELRATIRPGMSGGPVLNGQGQVIGVNRAVYAEGPRHSELVALPPLRRLLQQAADNPYADRAAMLQDVQAQYRTIADRVAADLVASAGRRERMGPFRLLAPDTHCQGTRFTAATDHFDVFRLRCDSGWEDEPDEHIPGPAWRMRHYWARNPDFNAVQTARAADYLLHFLREDEFTVASRYQTAWRCRHTRLTNQHGVTLDVHACRRRHAFWPGFQDHRLRVIALTPGPDVLVGSLDLNAVDSDGARHMTTAWLDAIEYRPRHEATRHTP